MSKSEAAVAETWTGVQVHFRQCQKSLAFKIMALSLSLHSLTCDDISAAILHRIAEQPVSISDEKLCDDCLDTDTLQRSYTTLHLLQLFAPSHAYTDVFYCSIHLYASHNNSQEFTFGGPA